MKDKNSRSLTLMTLSRAKKHLAEAWDMLKANEAEQDPDTDMECAHKINNTIVACRLAMRNFTEIHSYQEPQGEATTDEQNG